MLLRARGPGPAPSRDPGRAMRTMSKQAMPRTFLYARVSTAGQTTENQIREVEAAGFKVDSHRIVSETVSGSSAIEQRPQFVKLLDRLERGDVMIWTKLIVWAGTRLTSCRQWAAWKPWACGCIAWR
jgi:predicted site-specific integrase-resolvase